MMEKMKRGPKEEKVTLSAAFNKSVNQPVKKENTKHSADLASNKKRSGKKEQKCTIININQCEMNTIPRMSGFYFRLICSHLLLCLNAVFKLSNVCDAFKFCSQSIPFDSIY